MLKTFIISLVLFITTFFTATAQRTQPVRQLVFEGAGIRGIAYSGALAELETQGHLQTVQQVGGTSAGAIMALLVSLGYTSAETTAIVAGTDFRKFNDGRYFFPGGINRLNRYFGWYRGEKFKAWLYKLIAAKTGNAAITFRQMAAAGYRDLFVTGTNITKQQLVVFSKNNYPDMQVADAVRISMSVPFYFEAVFIDSAGRTVRHPRNKEGLDAMTDGGLTGNFPIYIFDSLGTCNPNTVGFRIDRAEQIASDRVNGRLAPMSTGNFRGYVGALYNMVIENLNRHNLQAADWKRTVSISDGNIGPRIRRLSADEINRLVENGRQATRNFLLN